MKTFKTFVAKITQHFRFAQGVAVGLTASSFLAYAVVNITSFSSGTTISSASVNNNFSSLKNAVEELQGESLSKLVGTITADFDVTCTASNSFPADFVQLPFIDEHGANASTYIVPVTGFYELRVDLTTNYGSGVVSTLENVTEGTNESMSMPTIRKYAAGTQLKFWVSCYSKGGKNLLSTIDYTKAYILFKKL